MALQAFIPYGSNGNDASLSILKRSEDLLRKGFVTSWYDSTKPGRRAESPAPLIQAVSGQLRVNVVSAGIGFLALGADGLVVRASGSDGPWMLTVQANVKNYIVLRVLYVPSSGGEVVEFNALTESQYTSSPYKDQFLIVGTITLGATTDATTGTIAYDERDRVEGLFDTNWRPSVDTFGSLPALVDEPTLKQGDCILVRDSLTIYGWDVGSTAWVPVGGAATLHAATSRGDQNMRAYLRAAQGSGILAGNINAGAFGHDVEMTLHEHPSTGTRLGVGQLVGLFNGHFVYTRTLDIDLSAKPGVGNRWDLVYVEVYRAALANPTTLTYADASGGTRTAAQISASIEQLLETADHNNTSFDVTAVEQAHDGTYVATVVALRTADNLALADIDDLYDPAGWTIAPVNNSDGNAWAWLNTYSDRRLWKATHASSFDGVSWGMPLYLVNRTSAENPGGGQGVLIYRSNIRHIFPVYPVANLGPAARDAGRALAIANTRGKPEMHDGFVVAEDFGFSGLIGQFPADPIISLLGRQVVLDNHQITMPSSPGAGGRSDFVMVTAKIVAFPDLSGAARTVIDLGEYSAVPYGPGYMRKRYLQLEVVSFDAGLTEDTPEAMAAEGYSPVAGRPGLWSKADSSFDPRIDDNALTYALPIALVPRFNSGSWDAGTNPNGGAANTRPDGYQHDQITWPVGQYRHMVAVSLADLEKLAARSFDDLLRGRLDTLVQRHPSHAGVSGVRHLVCDAVAGAGVSGYNLLPAAPDGFRHCWSEAEEIRPFGISFDPTGAFSDTIYTWTTGSPGHMRIVCPAGMAIYHPEIDVAADGLYLLQYDTAATPQDPLTWDAASTSVNSASVSNVTVNATDSFGYATDIEFDLTYSGSPLVHLYFWIIHKRSDSDVQHQDNRGLTARPNRIWGATWGAAGVGNTLGIRPHVANLTEVNFSGSILTFDAADIAAVTGYTGTHSFRGMLAISVVGEDRTSYTYAAEINDAQSQLQITFGVALVSKTVHVAVAWESTDVDRWLEFTRGGRCITGFYQFEDVEWTGMSGAFIYHATGTVSPNQLVMRHVCLMWRDTATGDPWDIIPEDQYGCEIYEGLGGFRIHSLAAGFQSVGKDYRAVVCKIRPPASSGEDFLIHYEASPYQGIAAKAGLANPADKLAELLQGRMAFEGKTFLTTMGHHPQYWHFEGSGQSRNPYHMFDLTADTKAESRSRALASSGTSLWRGQRILQLSGAEDVYTYYSFPNALIGDDLSGLMDALPWPDWSTVGGLYTTGDGPLEWSPNTIEPYDLYGYEIHAGGEWIAGGWFLYCDDMNVASQLGPSRPTADLSVEYGSGYLSDKTVMETASFVLGERGVAVSMWQYTAGSASPDIERFIADGTSYLAFGNMEGLLSTEMRQGVVGFEVRVPLPAYSHPAPAVRLGDTSEGWSGEYYGGHYTAIFTDTDEYLVMQVSGAPRGLSGTAPQPYAPRVGGVFDAFYLRGRPLPYKNF